MQAGHDHRTTTVDDSSAGMISVEHGGLLSAFQVCVLFIALLFLPQPVLTALPVVVVVVG